MENVTEKDMLDCLMNAQATLFAENKKELEIFLLYLKLLDIKIPNDADLKTIIGKNQSIFIHFYKKFLNTSFNNNKSELVFSTYNQYSSLFFNFSHFVDIVFDNWVNKQYYFDLFYKEKNKLIYDNTFFLQTYWK